MGPTRPGVCSRCDGPAETFDSEEGGVPDRSMFSLLSSAGASSCAFLFLLAEDGCVLALGGFLT